MATSFIIWSLISKRITIRCGEDGTGSNRVSFHNPQERDPRSDFEIIYESEKSNIENIKKEKKVQEWMLNEAKNNYGLNLIEKDDYKGAIKFYTDQIEDHPDNFELYFYRARAYREIALRLKRQNNHENNEEILEHFDNSQRDYDKVLEAS